MEQTAESPLFVLQMLLTTSLATNDVLSHFELIEGNRQSKIFFNRFHFKIPD